MISLLLVSAPSRVPFFIAGGALALWAVVLSVIGLRNPSFPGSEKGARGVMAISVALMLLAVAMAIVTDP